MTFTKLIDRISEEYCIDILSQEEDLEIQDVALFDNKHDSTVRTTLYFGYDKQFKNAVSLPAQCIIARTDSAIPLSFTTSNLAFVAEDSLFSLFNDVKFLVKTTRRGLFEELTTLADKTRNIETVIDAASVRLGNSLVFCDMNFKIIANSTSIPVLDPLWIENTKQGYCCYAFIDEAKKMSAIQNAPSTTGAVEVTCPKSPYRKLSSKVFHNQMQTGFLLMIEGENNFLPSHFEMLSTVSHVVSYTIAHYAADLFEKNSPYHELLYDMLIGAPSTDIIPKLVKLQFPSKMLVFYLQPTRYLGQQYLKNYVCRNLKIQFPGTHLTYHKNGVVAVIPLAENNEIDSIFLQRLQDFSQKEHVRIGVSNSFFHIENFVSHYEQAHAALELGHKLNPEEPIYLYSNYQIFDLLSEVRNPDRLDRFCLPALAILRQYDHENSSQLYKTLRVFLDKGCNIKLTSESLYIHRNSLVYRLNRITDMCQIDLSDIDTLFLLRLSFLIDQYNAQTQSLPKSFLHN